MTSSLVGVHTRSRGNQGGGHTGHCVRGQRGRSGQVRCRLRDHTEEEGDVFDAREKKSVKVYTGVLLTAHMVHS